MAIGYRAILRLEDANDAVVVAERAMRAWLDGKSRPGPRRTLETSSWEGPGTHRLGDASDLHVVHADAPDEGVRRRLYRLVERNDQGEFAVSLLAASLPSGARHRQTIVVEVGVAGLGRSDALAAIAPPRIVRRLLDAVPMSDGATRLTGRPIFVHRGDVGAVLEAIRDPERTASVIVAGSYGSDYDRTWFHVVESLTRRSVGVAGVYVVAHDAIDELDASLPATHRVGRARVRTFLPGVEFDAAADGLRHKWLTVATMSRSTSGSNVAEPLQRRHAEQARRRTVELELPEDVRRSLAILQRADADVERTARVEERVAAAKASAEEARRSAPTRTVPASVLDRARAWLERVQDLIVRRLGVETPRLDDLDKLDDLILRQEQDVRVADEMLTQAGEAESALDDELQGLRAENELLQLEAAGAQEEASALEREVVQLRLRLIEAGKADLTHVEPVGDEWASPTNIDELLTRITPGQQHKIFQRVVFTGDEDLALEIDKRDQVGRYARAFWECLHALYDYAELRCGPGFSGGVHAYLTDDRAVGEKVGPKRHAATESETVQRRPAWRDERLLPVPASVDPSGKVHMFAHFKPTHSDRFAPRMHYYDDTDGTGRIYVGYIGRHLTTKDSSSG